MVSNSLCEKVGKVAGVQAVFLVNEGSIIQLRAKKSAKMPPLNHMDNILVRRHMILALAGMQEGFLGKLHYNLSRYDESDVLLLDTPAGKKSMLMVMVKKPYDIDELLREIRSALKET